MPTEQKHPQENQDRAIIERISQEGKSDYNLAELARLIIRYNNFPGARDIQSKLKSLLQEWNLTEETLFTISRQLHNQQKIYQNRYTEDQQDWS
jgi:hypothetical protein